jgi:hypothetical protein
MELPVAYLVKKFPDLLSPKVHYRVHKRQPPATNLNHRDVLLVAREPREARESFYAARGKVSRMWVICSFGRLLSDVLNRSDSRYKSKLFA